MKNMIEAIRHLSTENTGIEVYVLSSCSDAKSMHEKTGGTINIFHQYVRHIGYFSIMQDMIEGYQAVLELMIFCLTAAQKIWTGGNMRVDKA